MNTGQYISFDAVPSLGAGRSRNRASILGWCKRLISSKPSRQATKYVQAHIPCVHKAPSPRVKRLVGATAHHILPKLITNGTTILSPNMT